MAEAMTMIITGGSDVVSRIFYPYHNKLKYNKFDEIKTKQTRYTTSSWMPFTHAQLTSCHKISAMDCKVSCIVRWIARHCKTCNLWRKRGTQWTPLYSKQRKNERGLLCQVERWLGVKDSFLANLLPILVITLTLRGEKAAACNNYATNIINN